LFGEWKKKSTAVVCFWWWVVDVSVSLETISFWGEKFVMRSSQMLGDGFDE